MEPDIDTFPPEDDRTVFDGLGEKVEGWYEYLKAGVAGAIAPKPEPKGLTVSGPVLAVLVALALVALARK